jgi:hypothetical protein
MVCGLGNLKRAAILASLCETRLPMIDPVNPNLGLVSCGATADRDSLKLWIRELTGLSPQQVEYVLSQQEQLSLATSSAK